MDINSFVIGFRKGKASGGGGGSLEGFHMVRFFNDDQTTLLYAVFVPTGASAMYAGETPVSTEDAALVFKGFEPTATNITADLDTYAVYDEIGTLDQTAWARIAEASADGTAQSYFAVGDTKMIHIEGTVGTLAVNGDYGVYIIGFDHNTELEEPGIHFGTFKSTVSNGKDICLFDSNNESSSSDGTKCFNTYHWGYESYGGWAGCDMRYDVLGSTDQAPTGYGKKAVSGRKGKDPSNTCTTNPVVNTLMAALPSDLRAVMKPMTKYTNNLGAGYNNEANVSAMVDYLPLLAEFEIFGVRAKANKYEQNKQKQYDYFVAGNSKIKYKHSETATLAIWWTRSPYSEMTTCFCSVQTGGTSSYSYSNIPGGLAPIFKV